MREGRRQDKKVKEVRVERHSERTQVELNIGLT